MKLKQFRFDECGDLTVDVFADDAMINAEPFTVSGLPGAYVIVDINPDANRWLVAVGWIDADGNPEEYARYFSCREAALVEAKSLPVELPLIGLRNIGYGSTL